MSSRPNPKPKKIGNWWWNAASNVVPMIDIPGYKVNLDKLKRSIPSLVYLYENMKEEHPQFGHQILSFFKKIHILELFDHRTDDQHAYVFYECYEKRCIVFKLKDGLPIAIDKQQIGAAAPQKGAVVKFDPRKYLRIVSDQSIRTWWNILIWLNEAEELYRYGMLLK